MLISSCIAYSPESLENSVVVQISKDENTNSEEPRPPNSPWIDDGIMDRIEFGQERVRVTVITSSLDELDSWQHRHEAIEKQAPPQNSETLVRTFISGDGINHRTFWVDSDIFHKIAAVRGVLAVIDAQRAPEPYDTAPLGQNPLPSSVRTGEIHGANDAWSRGYTGEGLVVAVADTGVDFAHPDLNGTQARVSLEKSSYDGWPLMFDHNSMYSWVVDGLSYPETDTWYANTSTLDFDNDSDGLLDFSGLNISGINASLSGIYHLGEHPDRKLRDRVGGDVPILVVDDISEGLYETVWPDLDRDGAFGNETPMRPGEETSGLDDDGDGLWDISAGLVYWVSNGQNGVPYGETYSSRHGYSDRVPGSGNLVLFMLESGNHGTLCASAISAQGRIDSGRVLGMSPDAKISSIGNHYSGGHALDAWRFIAEGYDGDPQTPDQPHIGSFSFGYSSIDDSGADGYSLYLDWITRVYNRNSTYAVAIGNGGHGFGTTKVPGAAHGVFSVGAFSSRESGSWGQSAPWSNRGPNVVGRMDPDIVSVGWSATGDLPLNDNQNANSSWTTWGGTSLATPVVAGLLAIVEEAWIQLRESNPDSQELRDFVLSTADDRGYEPFVQGGGWMNVSRSVATLEGDNGTWSMSPSQWNSGTFHGKHRDANLNSILPGNSQSFNISIDNPSQSELSLNLSPVKFSPLQHEVLVWNSIGNGSNGGENDSWDGHQEDRPDLLIPIHIRGNSTYQLPEETVQFRARATIQYEAFDMFQERSSKERVFLQIYRWTDFDGDGIFHNDSDLDGMVDNGEWSESEELEEVTYWWSNGPQAEVRLGMPFEDSSDGIFLGVWRFSDQLSGVDPVRIEVDWTSFGIVDDDWISVQQNLEMPPESKEDLTVRIEVPIDAVPGLHQHGIRIESQSSGDLQTFRNWTLPIVTNVPWEGPFSITPNPLDGNTSNQTLYSESWISGAMRWSWRPESGDWRFLTVEWPESLSGEGAIILDVDWDDNPYTDIDLLWLSEVEHEYYDQDTESYGPNTFFIEERSTNNHVTSGQHNWGTNTGTSRETLVVPPTAGTHQLVIHTALHGVQTNDNPLNISVGFIAAESSGFDRTVYNWSQGSGNDSAFIVSTMDLPVESIDAHGWVQPIHLTNQTANQDDPNDKMSASWWHNLTIEEATEISISIDSYEDADLDLFLFRDDDGDGNFSSNEEIRRSWGSDSSESISIDNPSDGLYGVAVHGWSVDGGSTGFWADIEVISGDSLAVDEFTVLNESQINSIWPSGSEDLGGLVPKGATELSISFETPPDEGTWTGFVDLSLTGGSMIRIPYQYNLIDSEPQISFITPNNLTETNDELDLRLHVSDFGSGFFLEDLNWTEMIGNSINGSRVLADSAWGSDIGGLTWNLTSAWNGFSNNSLSARFREVWINSTLPSEERWFYYQAHVQDSSGKSNQTSLMVSFDETAPDLFVTDVPWITSSSNIQFNVQTEENSVLRLNGVEIPVNQSGFAQVQTSLLISQSGIYSDGDGDLPFYFNEDSNVFDISSTDPAGNTANSSFQVIYDPIPPVGSRLVSLESEESTPFDPREVHHPVNVSIGEILIEVPADAMKWCITFTNEQFGESSTNCQLRENQLLIMNNSSIMPISGILENSANFTQTIPFDLSEISDGDCLIELVVWDWANNTHLENWNLSLDRELPAVSWSLEGSVGDLAKDHAQNLSWWASEEVNVGITVNGIELAKFTGESDSIFFELERTGIHTVCIFAVDMTAPLQNNNSFSECRHLNLEKSVYDTNLGQYFGDLVSADSIEVIVKRHQSQEIRWTRQGSSRGISIGPGQEMVTIDLELEEGMNQFLFEIDALDEIDYYSFSVERDSLPPVLSFQEEFFRNSPLASIRQISGHCEPGLLVNIKSSVQSRDIFCSDSGNFSSEILVPSAPGSHLVEARSTDPAENEMYYSIEVIKQDWSEWAISDARSGGPMIWWFSLGGLLSVAGAATSSRLLIRKGDL